MGLVRVVNEVCGFTIKGVESGQSVIIRVGHGTVIALHVGCLSGVLDNPRLLVSGITTPEKLIKKTESYIFQ